MRNKLFLSSVLILFFLSVSLYFFNQNNSELLDLVSAKSLSLFSCNYNDITHVFRLHGMPSQSMVRDVNKLSPGYLNVLISNLIINRTEMYLYGLGNDLLLNTQDDFAYNLNAFQGGPAPWTINPVMVLENGSLSNYDLYWVEHTSSSKNIKSCRITSTGCTNVTIKAIVPVNHFRGFNPSPLQNRIYVAYNTKVVMPGYQYDYSTFRSCSMATGSNNYCLGNFSNYTLYPHINQYNVTYDYYDNVPELGFIVKPNYPINYTQTISDPDFTYFFNMNANNSGEVVPLPTMDPEGIVPLGLDTLLALRKDVNYLNDTISLIHISSATYTDIDTLPESINYAFFLDFNTVIVLYRDYNSLTWGRRYGGYSNLIYNNTIGPEVAPKFILNDGSVIGSINNNNQFRVVKFMCSP